MLLHVSRMHHGGHPGPVAGGWMGEGAEVGACVDGSDCNTACAVMLPCMEIYS